MKAKILDKNGKGSKEIEIPSIFNSKVRVDITQKYYEVMKTIQPYGPNKEAGKGHSASGKIRHRRHVWKSSYGRGISRVPRKIFWRRGSQFYWQGATISSAVGGRRAHPPRPEQFINTKKINKKEVIIAISSALSATTSAEYVNKRYESVEIKELKFPIVIDSKIIELKTQEFLESMEKILKDGFKVAVKDKLKKAGRSNMRGIRRRNAGALLVIGNEEDKKISRLDIKKVKDLEIGDFWPLGRLTLYTEKAIEDINKHLGTKTLK